MRQLYKIHSKLSTVKRLPLSKFVGPLAGGSVVRYTAVHIQRNSVGADGIAAYVFSDRFGVVPSGTIWGSSPTNAQKNGSFPHY